MKHILIASTVVLGGAFCSLSAVAGDLGTAGTAAEEKAPAKLQPMEYQAQPPNCLQETGSRIAPKDGCISMANGRSYDRDQLTANRDLTLAGSLVRDPAITIENHR